MNVIAASIIVPCFNQLEFTRQCLRALFRYTRPAFELIVIDNGSTDGTGAYLAGVQDSSPAPVTVISNGRNLGFPAAVNQGLRVARGQYLVLLNNDAVVTDGWLDQLIALGAMKTDFHKEGQEVQERERKTEGTTNQTNLTNGIDGERGGSRIGLVGPMSNYASPPQLVQNVPYKGLEEMHAFARRWRDEHRGQWFTAGNLSGFCLLMKRAVYETIGGLDERFGLGFFDDDDLAVRARKAGFELAVAHDLFVHHFGSRTFQESKGTQELRGRESFPRQRRTMVPEELRGGSLFRGKGEQWSLALEEKHSKTTPAPFPFSRKRLSSGFAGSGPVPGVLRVSSQRLEQHPNDTWEILDERHAARS
jgi:GT2 family glycosyltransferase